jgi:cysteine sulfinate desulfinase/cysteine desulfurase-like protein
MLAVLSVNEVNKVCDNSYRLREEEVSIRKGLFKKDKNVHIITTQTEHKCILDSCRSIQNDKIKVTYLPVKKDGLIDLNLLIKLAKKSRFFEKLITYYL